MASSKDNRTAPPYTDFEDGDIFYTGKDGEFSLFKVLKAEPAYGTLHLMIFQPLEQLPAPEELDSLQVMVYHAPIAIDGFDGPQLLAKTEVRDEELLGYFEYIKQVHHTDELVAHAQRCFQAGYELTEEGRNEEAIDKYTIAIDLIPAFYEAIDNRAFCKMNLARWQDAIEDFELSLEVEPENTAALFSIGECYFKMRDYPRAQEWFERCLEVDPGHRLSQDFLRRTVDLMGKG